jgi:hypothetical protein
MQTTVQCKAYAAEYQLLAARSVRAHNTATVRPPQGAAQARSDCPAFRRDIVRIVRALDDG